MIGAPCVFVFTSTFELIEEEGRRGGVSYSALWIGAEAAEADMRRHGCPFALNASGGRYPVHRSWGVG